MITIIIQIILIGALAFVPILIWAYIFSYLDNSSLNSHRFVAGIFAGAVSVLPVLYLDNILKFVGLEKFNILNFISSNIFMPGNVAIALIITIIAIAIFSLIAGLFFLDNISKIFRTYIKNIFILCIFVVIYLILYYLIKEVGLLSGTVKNPISISNAIFNTTGLVLLYYIIVGLLEESSKHFNFIPSSLVNSNNINKGVLYAIFIALGFGFIENILYLFNILSQNGFNGDLISTWIFRGIFSLFVHILCSSIVAFGFIKIYLDQNVSGTNNMNYIKSFLWAFILSIIVHAIYDISLTLGFSIIIFIYLIFGYFYLTKIFYKES